MLEQFHFTQPFWLLALLPLLLLLRLGFHSSTSSKAWAKVIDSNLLPVLLQGKNSGSAKFAKSLLALGWLIAVIALADPVWEKIPRPIFQTNAARVLVLDLSNSMLVDDLKPNRLARAKFKVEDILSLDEEGQTGLVLFAGDAFIASPLTRDTETIRSLLKILTPQLMPSQGSRADLGLQKAHELFKQAGIKNGQVLMIADGISRRAAAMDAAKALQEDGHSVSVLGVGTEAGGELKFTNNQKVSVKLEVEKLKNVASIGGGNYHLISTSNADLSQVLVAHDAAGNANENALQEQDINNEEWYSTGPLIALLLLPLAALAFRRGWLLNIAFIAISGGVLIQPQPVQAFTLDDLWSTLSQNKEQRADAAFRRQNYEKASELSQTPFRRGTAEYRQGKFEQALESFKKSKGANARYNEGNSLAKLERYEDAIKSYDKALEINPDMSDAKENKKAIEELLKQQQEQQQSDENSKENSDSDSQKKQENKDSEGKDKDGEGGEQSGQEKQGDKEGESSENSSDNKKEGKEQNNKEGSSSDDEKSKKDENQFSDANKALDKEKQQQDANKNSSVDSKDSGEKEAQIREKPGGKIAEQEKEQEEKQSAKSTEGESNAQAEQEAEAKQNAFKQADTEKAKELSEEEKMAAEQWLRRIPDDPGGLLRRKFRSQYQQRNRSANNSEQPW